MGKCQRKLPVFAPRNLVGWGGGETPGPPAPPGASQALGAATISSRSEAL